MVGVILIYHKGDPEMKGLSPDCRVLQFPDADEDNQYQVPQHILEGSCVVDFQAQVKAYMLWKHNFPMSGDRLVHFGPKATTHSEHGVGVVVFTYRLTDEEASRFGTFGSDGANESDHQVDTSALPPMFCRIKAVLDDPITTLEALGAITYGLLRS